MAAPQPPTSRIGHVELTFSDPDALQRLGDPVAKDLSAVARAGNCPFLACDEAAGLERLSKAGDDHYSDHRHILLADFFDLPGGPDEEMDIEGLAAVDGYLWIVGSHSLKRKKPEGDDGEGAEASRAWKRSSARSTASSWAVCRWRRKRPASSRFGPKSVSAGLPA